MKLTVFQSDKGDCLLLTSEDEKRILVDGGMSWSFRDHVAPALGAIRESGGKLDLVYVSHVDQDHISGIVEMLDYLVAWRVLDFQRKSGNQAFPEPECPRPPEITEIWHNSFSELISRNEGPVEELLATSAATLEGGTSPVLQMAALEQRNLATGVADAIELRHRVSPEQLNIPVNRPFAGRLALAKTPSQVVNLGSLRISVIAPSTIDVSNLRREWDEWLRNEREDLADIQARMREDVERLGTTEVDALTLSIEQAAKKLGQRAQVTPPNLASLMLLVSEGNKSLLLTGDGHQDDILAGLKRASVLDDRGAIHLDVLKVQHHCSENNLNEEFCRLVTADNYVFCANGGHENPDLDALKAIIDSRLGPEGTRTANPDAGGNFKFWFNSSVEATSSETNKGHMRKVQDLVTASSRASGGRMSSFFLKGHSFELPI